MTDGEHADHGIPLGGLYLYMHEGNDPIVSFVQENPEWFARLYSQPLNEILDMFDHNASKMAGSGCFATGMHGIKTAEIYQKALQKKVKK